MVHVNLILWLAMFGAVLTPAPDHVAKWTAVAGLVVAALWEHSAVRGFLRPKKDTPDATGASPCESRAARAPASERRFVMRRKLFNLVAALSLCLFIATALLWVRSYWTADFLHINAHVRETAAGVTYGQYEFDSGGGWMILIVSPYYETLPAQRTAIEEAGKWVHRQQRLSQFDIVTARWLLSRLWSFEGRRHGKGDGFRAAFPHWPLLAVTAVLPLLWLRRQRSHRRRRRHGLCPACGYDVRATPERCPECGNTISLLARPAA